MWGFYHTPKNNNLKLAIVCFWDFLFNIFGSQLVMGSWNHKIKIVYKGQPTWVTGVAWCKGGCGHGDQLDRYKRHDRANRLKQRKVKNMMNWIFFNGCAFHTSARRNGEFAHQLTQYAKISTRSPTPGALFYPRQTRTMWYGKLFLANL